MRGGHGNFMAEADIPVRVAYALPGVQTVIALSVPPGTRAREALLRSGLAASHAGIDPRHCTLGVFGRLVGDDYVLQAGDRVEVYRPLAQDPREARRDNVLRRGPAGR